ncbi:MAG: hypothetical protein ABH885_02740 [Candidatus Omnitrophota bacterium]
MAGAVDIKILREWLDDKRHVALVVVLVSAALVGYVLIFAVDMGRFREVRASIVEKRDNLFTAKALTAQKNCVNMFDMRYNVANVDVTQWLIHVVTNTAERASVSISLVKPVEPREDSGYVFTRILVEGGASYDNMARFIAKLENNEKSIIIEECYFSAKDIYKEDMDFEKDFQKSGNSDTSFYTGRLVSFRMIAACLSQKR